MLSEELTAEEREARRQRQREYERRYRATHPQRVRELACTRTRRYYAAHSEERRAARRQYYTEHGDECRAQHRTYCGRHRVELAESQRRYGRSHPGWGRRPCMDCGKLCRGRRRSEPRCRKCDSLLMAGPNSPMWKGGVQKGYRVIGHQLEHRLAWEAAHGPIRSGDVIHHRNGDKTDNRLENLVAMTNAEHARLHMLSLTRTGAVV